MLILFLKDWWFSHGYSCKININSNELGPLTSFSALITVLPPISNFYFIHKKEKKSSIEAVTIGSYFIFIIMLHLIFFIVAFSNVLECAPEKRKKMHFHGKEPPEISLKPSRLISLIRTTIFYSHVKNKLWICLGDHLFLVPRKREDHSELASGRCWIGFR